MLLLLLLLCLFDERQRNADNQTRVYPNGIPSLLVVVNVYETDSQREYVESKQ